MPVNNHRQHFLLACTKQSKKLAWKRKRDSLATIWKVFIPSFSKLSVSFRPFDNFRLAAACDLALALRQSTVRTTQGSHTAFYHVKHTDN